MEDLEHGSTTDVTTRAPIHRWDARTRSNACGAPGQTGSTKHERGVTCEACLDRLERDTAAAAPVEH